MSSFIAMCQATIASAFGGISAESSTSSTETLVALDQPQKDSVGSFPVAGLADWSILKKLGEGGFGGVYLGRNKRTSELQAIKVVSKHTEHADRLLQAVIDERCALEVVSEQDSFFLNLKAAFHDSENYYFVTDFLPGGTLLDRGYEVGAFDENTTRFYMAEVVHAVSRMHAKSVLHRDIKPENILLNAQGHISIADFGLAHVFTSPDTNNHFIREICGTPNYMAPEVESGDKYSYAADVYSIGTTFYVIVMSELPFQDSTAFERAQLILSKGPVDLDGIISDDLRQLL